MDDFVVEVSGLRKTYCAGGALVHRRGESPQRDLVLKDDPRSSALSLTKLE